MTIDQVTSVYFVRGRPPSAGSDVETYDLIRICDDLNRHILSIAAPPFHPAGLLEAVFPTADATLVVQWEVRDWPGKGSHTWFQLFKDGIELAKSVGTPDQTDLELHCSYRDFAAFLLGARYFEDFVDGLHVAGGGIGAMSCVSGLMFADQAPRRSAIGLDQALAVYGIDNAVVVDGR